MSTVLKRSTLEIFESVNTPDYSEVDYLINPDLSALTYVPKYYWKLSGETVLEMSAEEKTAVDASRLAIVKATKQIQLDLATRGFINSKYPLERQSSLQLLRNDARADNKINRFNYINQVVAWSNSVLEYHYIISDQIQASNSITAVNEIVFNHAENTLVDPNVTIRGTMAIND